MKKIVLIHAIGLLGLFAGAQEFLYNQDLKKRNPDGSADGWIRGIVVKAPDNNELDALQITEKRGSAAQYFRIRPSAGELFLVTGRIFKTKGNNHGSISIRSDDHKRLITYTGSDTAGEWVAIKAVYTANGKEAYFECLPDYMGEDGEAVFAEVSFRKVTRDEADEALKKK